MVNHWNIRIFPFYIQKYILINQINLESVIIFLYISILNSLSVSYKETDAEKSFEILWLILIQPDILFNYKSTLLCMAKNGDIIDAMLGWIFELIGWIFNMLIKLIVALVGGLFSLIGSGIKALFSKNKSVKNE